MIVRVSDWILSSMKHFLFIDIETDCKGKIVDSSAILNGQELHERQSFRLEK